MRLLQLAAILLSLSLFSACSKDEPSLESDYTVFGAFSLECSGQCFKLYKLDNVQHHLYEDTSTVYLALPSPERQGQYALRSQAQYDQVRDLSDKIPASLLAMPNGDVNISAVIDAPTYYVEIQQDNQKRYWYLDADKANLPSSLHAFHDEVKARIDLLR